MAASKKAVKPKNPKSPKRARSKNYRSKYSSFKLSRRIKHEYHDDMPPTWKLIYQTLSLMKKNWKVFATVAVVYGFFYIVLVQGTIFFDATENREFNEDLLSESTTGFFISLATLSSLFGVGLGANSEVKAVYLSIISIMSGLAYIWALRNIWANKVFRLRDIWYKGMYPLVPFMIVLVSIVLMLIPISVLGSWFLSLQSNGLIATGAEQYAVYLLLFLVALLTLYSAMGALVALFISTIPDTDPVDAIMSGYKLVSLRRGQIFGRFFFFVLFNAIAMFLVLLLLVGLVPKYTFTFLVFLTIFSFPYTLTYLYTLYRRVL